MKFLILVCAVIATTLAYDPEQVKASHQKVKQAVEACNADPATHVDIEALKKSRSEGKHEEPANLGPHSLCVSKKLGWQNEDGSVNVEVIRSRATAIFGDNDKLEEIIKECSKQESTPEATAKHIFGCYRKHEPHPSGTLPRHHD